MTKEILLQKHREHSEKYRERHAAFYANPSVSRIEPFKIADRQLA
jgi:hypothetical protein